MSAEFQVCTRCKKMQPVTEFALLRLARGWRVYNKVCNTCGVVKAAQESTPVSKPFTGWTFKGKEKRDEARID